MARIDPNAGIELPEVSTGLYAAGTVSVIRAKITTSKSGSSTMLALTVKVIDDDVSYQPFICNLLFPDNGPKSDSYNDSRVLRIKRACALFDVVIDDDGEFDEGDFVDSFNIKDVRIVRTQGPDAQGIERVNFDVKFPRLDS